jgi:hypothetical protein
MRVSLNLTANEALALLRAVTSCDDMEESIWASLSLKIENAIAQESAKQELVDQAQKLKMGY